MKEIWLRWRWLIIGVLLMAALAAGAGYGYQAYNANLAKEREEETLRQATAIADTVASSISQFRSELVGSLDYDALIRVLQDDDETTVHQVQKELAATSSRIMRAWLLAPNVSYTDYSTVPPLSFASLELLKRSQASEPKPEPEVHLHGQEGGHVAIVEPIVQEGSLVGNVLVAVRPDMLIGLLEKASISDAYAELVQPVQGAPLVLARAGTKGHRLGLPQLTVKVQGTAWRVAFWTKVASKQSDSNTVLAIGAGVGVLILVLVGYFMRRSKKPQKEEAPAVTSARTKRVLAARKEQRTVSETVPIEPMLDSVSQGGIVVEEEDETQATEVEASIFRAYDIRGVVGETLSAEVANVIGRAIGSEAYHRGQQTIVVGRDGRHSGPELAAALMDGLRAAGRDVIELGAVPTPLLYFATHYLKTGSGVMVTGSHNPADYNGFKIMLGGETLFGDHIGSLKTRIDEQNFESGEGGLQAMDVSDEYIRRVCEDIPVALGNSFKVVVDCGNGIAGDIAPKLLRSLGHDVVELYCDVNGDFPNHHPDPSQPENLEDLIRSVREQGADLGFAFDGDGDRIGLVDSRGRIIWPDQQMMLFAKDVLSTHPGAEIIYDVKCTNRLAQVIKQLGGKPVMTKTGHSFIKNKLLETDAPLAGEMSGHIFFKDRWYGFDDAIYSAARMLEILAGFKQAPGKIFAKLPSGISTPELRVDLQEGEQNAFMETLLSADRFSDGQVSTIDGVRVDYEHGWGLVRASNTTPSLVMRFEANDEENLKRIQEAFKKVILEVKPDLSLPF